MKASLKKENLRPWSEVEEEFNGVEYQKVRAQQLRELELEDDVMGKLTVRYALLISTHRAEQCA